MKASGGSPPGAFGGSERVRCGASRWRRCFDSGGARGGSRVPRPCCTVRTGAAADLVARLLERIGRGRRAPTIGVDSAGWIVADATARLLIGMPRQLSTCPERRTTLAASSRSSELTGRPVRAGVRPNPCPSRRPLCARKQETARVCALTQAGTRSSCRSRARSDGQMGPRSACGEPRAAAPWYRLLRPLCPSSPRARDAWTPGRSWTHGRTRSLGWGSTGRRFKSDRRPTGASPRLGSRLSRIGAPVSVRRRSSVVTAGGPSAGVSCATPQTSQKPLLGFPVMPPDRFLG